MADDGARHPPRGARVIIRRTTKPKSRAEPYNAMLRCAVHTESTTHRYLATARPIQFRGGVDAERDQRLRPLVPLRVRQPAGRIDPALVSRASVRASDARGWMDLKLAICADLRESLARLIAQVEVQLMQAGC